MASKNVPQMVVPLKSGLVSFDSIGLDEAPIVNFLVMVFVI